MKKISKMQKDNYWKKRNYHYRIFFNLKKKIWQFDSFLNREKTNNKNFLRVINKSLMQFLITVVICWGIIYLDLQLIENKLLSSIVTENNLSDIVAIICSFIAFDGVFLAIYYSSTASIYTAKYSSIKEKLRNLYFNESVKYSKFLISNVMSLSCLAIILFLGYKISLLSVIFFGAQTLANIYSFQGLGSIAFSLSNIYKLGEYSRNNIVKLIRKIEKDGIFSEDVSFQNYFLQIAKSEIENLNDILKYQQNYQENDEEGYEFCSKNIMLLNYYLIHKKYIKRNSKWFDVTGESRSWFTENIIFTNVALNTGTSLPYKEVVDRNWFEKNLFFINDSFLKEKATSANSILICNYLQLFSEMCRLQISCDNLDIINDEISNLENIVMEYIQKADENNSIHIALAWYNLLQNIVVGIKGYFNNIGQIPNDLKNIINKIYKKDYIRKLKYLDMNDVEILELSEMCLLEIKVENKRKTPDWYFGERLAQIYRPKINKMFLFSNYLFELYEKTMNTFKEHDNRELTALGILSYKKIKNDIKEIQQMTCELEEKFMSLNIDDSYSHKNYDYNELIEKQSTKMKNDIENYEIIFNLYKEGFVNNTTNPDYIGFAFYNLINDAFNLLIEDEFDIFKDHIKCLIENVEQIESEVKRVSMDFQNNAYKYKLLTLTYVMAMELCGYFIYYMNLINNDEEIEKFYKILDDYFIIQDSYMNKISKFILAYRVDRHLNHFGMTSFDSLYMNFKQAFASHIRQKELIRFEQQGWFQKVIIHNKSIIKKFTYDEMMGFSNDFCEIFAIEYLNRFQLDEKLSSKHGWEEKQYGD